MIITPLYAGLLAFWFLALSWRVVQMRNRISLGDGGDPEMLRRIRGHGNFSEYVPFILLMIGFLEISKYPGWLIHALGATLLVARLLHGFALSFTDRFKFGRFWGTFLTFCLLAACGGLCVYQGITGAATP